MHGIRPQPRLTMSPLHPNRRVPLALTSMAAATLFAAMSLPASAQFISSDRTVANGNPLNGNYGGQGVIVGASAFVNGFPVRVANVKVDIVAPAQFNFSDATGGSMGLYSNSIVTMQGGTFGSSGTFANVGRLSVYDTSTVTISGGSLAGITINGTAAGDAGARVSITGGQLVVPSGVGTLVQNGALSMSGGSLLTSGSFQPAIYGVSGSVISIAGGLVQSASYAAVYLDAASVFSMSGGSITGGTLGGAQWGLRTEAVAATAVLRGGTVNGGIRTTALNSQVMPQAALGGNVTVNGGVFAYGNAVVDVTGGSYTRFAGADASFFAMGTNSINFFGTGLALSAPVSGQVFETNNYTGNFYTFTSGTFSDGQSAVGLRLFDAVSVAGNNLPGGFTLNPSPVPEPGTWLLMLLALPAVAAAARRACRT